MFNQNTLDSPSTPKECPMKTPEVLRDDEYTFAELRLMLTRVRRAPVPRSTLYYWLDCLGIVPKPLYTDEEFQWLKALCKWLCRGGKVRVFQKRMNEVLNNAHQGRTA
jgi:hypothetical protein